MEFRKDINGLRAIAVIAVVLFHFGIPRMQGGFVGVDIFFVISGFLMTGIISQRMKRGDFSTVEFYLARGRRIVPALVVLCLVLLAAGWFALPPLDYKTLGKHAAVSLGFLSNHAYLGESGYFDADSHEKWLLHTWSLSIEWQFYLIYPIIIVLLRKLQSEAVVRWSLLGLAASSFALSIFLSVREPSAAFYILPTRAWELLAGALVYLFPLNASVRVRPALQVVGLVLIALAVTTIRPGDTWPGWLALLPVVGTMLVLMAAQRNSLVTGNPIAQFLGTTSYSIYLWHWPLVVAINYLGSRPKPMWILLAILGSVVAGYLSYRFVEVPARGPSGRLPKFGPYLRLALPVLLVGSLGSLAFFTKGAPSRASAEFNERTRDLLMPLISNGWCFYSVDSINTLPVGEKGLKCEIGDTSSKIRGLAFGDSFSAQNDPFWDIVASDLKVRINSISTNWCHPSITDEFAGPPNGRAYAQCMIDRRYLQHHLSDYDFVVFAGAWGLISRRGMMQGVLDVISLAAMETKLVVVMSAPTSFDVDVRRRYERHLFLRLPFDINAMSTERDRQTQHANETLRTLSGNFNNVVFLDRDSLFSASGVRSDVTADGIPYTLDGLHISLYGARSSARSFMGTRSYSDLRQRIGQLRGDMVAEHSGSSRLE